jgi:hypothetical protein
MLLTLSRLYPDGRIARAVVDELAAAGLPQDDIGIIAPSRERSLRVVGGEAPLPGLGAFVLPGIGAVVAAGWAASDLAGALAGGVVGVLIEAGVTQIEAVQFAEGIKRGGILVTVRVMARDRAYYEAIMAMTHLPHAVGH